MERKNDLLHFFPMGTPKVEISLVSKQNWTCVHVFIYIYLHLYIHSHTCIVWLSPQPATVSKPTDFSATISQLHNFSITNCVISRLPLLWVLCCEYIQFFHPEHYGLHGSYRNMLTESMIIVKIITWKWHTNNYHNHAEWTSYFSDH